MMKLDMPRRRLQEVCRAWRTLEKFPGAFLVVKETLPDVSQRCNGWGTAPTLYPLGEDGRAGGVKLVIDMDFR